jgi:kynureninase
VSSRADAAALDANDELAGFREHFVFVGDSVYLDGNSLGRLPRATAERLRHVIEVEWGQRLIGSWTRGWLELPVQLGDQIGSVALGAAPGQVAVGDSTTVNLYKLAGAALNARRGRTQIVTDRQNFPTDRYVLEGLAEQCGRGIHRIDCDPAAGPTPEAVAAVVGEDTALVSFSHVAYRSAHIADMEAITQIVHDAGALMLWDLSHSGGSVPVELDRCGVDLAVGCTYKYLNGGPGAPAYLYVRADLQEQLRQPIQGWLGRRDPFEMGPVYEPAAGIGSYLSGTPPILSLAGVEEGVKLVAKAGIGAIRAKGIALTEFAIALADAHLAEHGVRVASPRDSEHRGAHVALAHPDARRLTEALIAAGIIVDFRAPDVVRIGLSPLTTRFDDVWAVIDALAGLLA